MTDRHDIINLAGDAHLDEAMEPLLADYLRNLGQRMRDTHPDRGQDFSEGVAWAASRLDVEAEQ
jgi:hypothetical protein